MSWDFTVCQGLHILCILYGDLLCPHLSLERRHSFSQLPGLLVADYLLQVCLGGMPCIKRDHFTQVYVSSPGIAHSLWLANAEAQWPDVLVLIWENWRTSPAPSSLGDELRSWLQRYDNSTSLSCPIPLCSSLYKGVPPQPPACQALPLSLVRGESDLRESHWLS